MVHLISVGPKRSKDPPLGFPFNLPFVQTLQELTFKSPVTFLVGENGSGKSTLLEAIAAGTSCATIGGEDIDRDRSLEPARRLARNMRFAWRRKNHRGFFLRAEDFFNFARRLQSMIADLERAAAEYEKEYSGYALGLARGAVLSQRQALISKYGENLDANSHGESFLRVFHERFVPGGLYLMDEPEAPLSPQRQLALLAMIKEMIAKDAQFIIATHSPILMSFPDAVIFSFDKQPVSEVNYEDVEHVALTKAFLNNPQSFLRHL
jgi:predicted ATPase